MNNIRCSERSDKFKRNSQNADEKRFAFDDDENGESPREAVLCLTEKIVTALRTVTLNLETAEELETVVKAEALFLRLLVQRKTLQQEIGEMIEK